MKYKVWVHIEAIEEDIDFYQDVAEPEEAGEFDTLEDAKKHADSLLKFC